MTEHKKLNKHGIKKVLEPVTPLYSEENTEYEFSFSGTCSDNYLFSNYKDNTIILPEGVRGWLARIDDGERTMLICNYISQTITLKEESDINEIISFSSNYRKKYIAYYVRRLVENIYLDLIRDEDLAGIQDLVELSNKSMFYRLPDLEDCPEGNALLVGLEQYALKSEIKGLESTTDRVQEILEFATYRMSEVNKNTTMEERHRIAHDIIEKIRSEVKIRRNIDKSCKKKIGRLKKLRKENISEPNRISQKLTQKLMSYLSKIDEKLDRKSNDEDTKENTNKNKSAVEKGKRTTEQTQNIEEPTPTSNHEPSNKKLSPNKGKSSQLFSGGIDYEVHQSDEMRGISKFARLLIRVAVSVMIFYIGFKLINSISIIHLLVLTALATFFIMAYPTIKRLIIDLLKKLMEYLNVVKSTSTSAKKAISQTDTQGLDGAEEDLEQITEGEGLVNVKDKYKRKAKKINETDIFLRELHDKEIPDYINEREKRRNSVSKTDEEIRSSIIAERKEDIKRALEEMRTGYSRRHTESGHRLDMERYIQSRLGDPEVEKIFEKTSRERKGKNVVGVCMDSSGSMNMKRARKIIVSLHAACSIKNDKFAACSFSKNRSHLITLPDEKMNWKDLESIKFSGSTPMSRGMVTCTRLIETEKENKVMFVLTDGKPNRYINESNESEKIVKQLKKRNITVVGIGIGNSVDEETMEEIFQDDYVMADDENLSQELIRIYKENSI